MLIEDQYMFNKSIMVGVLGEPNVGKSSLINHLLGFDLTPVTPKPQTTRNQFHCILTIDHTEVILVDTPGLHRSGQELNKRMNGQAIEGTSRADLNLVLIDVSRDVLEQIDLLVEQLKNYTTPSYLVFTKIDLLQDPDNYPFESIFKVALEKISSFKKYFAISSHSETNIHLLTGAICDEAKPGPHLYPRKEASNRPERFFAAEYVREAAFMLLQQELPYEMAVVVDEYKDLKEDELGDLRCYISATILVNRPSQRGIVVGSKGSMIKQIGEKARMRIEQMVGGRVHLNLHVKVSQKWFKNNQILEQLGLPRVEGSARVWRQHA